MDFMLRHYRAKLVRKYRDHPQGWPDGIDTKFDRWYSGKEDEWPDDKVALWSSLAWVDEQARGNVTLAVTPEERKRMATRERVARWRAEQLRRSANPEAEDE